MIAKYPFAVRRSDFDQREVYKFNSIDQYGYNNDDDSDKFDEDDSDKDDDEDENNKLQIPVDTNRKRASGLIIHASMDDIDDIDDLEGDIEIEEIVVNDTTKSVILTAIEEVSSDGDEPLENSMVKDDLMSPESNKKKSTQTVND